MSKGPWYNTDIFSNLQRFFFEYFITHSRTDRYNILCYIIAHDKEQTSYEDEEISIGDRQIPKTSTTEALKALGFTFNFIDIWLKLLD